MYFGVVDRSEVDEGEAAVAIRSRLGVLLLRHAHRLELAKELQVQVQCIKILVR